MARVTVVTFPALETFYLIDFQLLQISRPGRTMGRLERRFCDV